MLLSFFSKTDYITDNPQTGNPDCIIEHDILVFDDVNNKYELDENNNLVVSEYEKIETEQEKKARITLALIISNDPTSVDTEGVKWFDIDYCISQRFFGWDRWKEIWFTQKFTYLLSLSKLTPEQEAEKKMIIGGYEKKEDYKNYLKSINA